MLKSGVGYSKNLDYYVSGIETAEMATNDLNEQKLGFLYTSCNDDIKEVLKGIRTITSVPLIGCTSSGGLIVPDGIIESNESYAGMLVLNDSEMTVGVACHEAGKNPRAIGRKVAIDAVANAKTTRAPAYFYMVASPKEEEEYLLGIQDVIGRVPMFGGSAADDTVDENWKIICNDKVFKDGVAVAFFYTDNEIETSFTGAYRETNNVGIVTKVDNDRELVEINGVGALKQYADWTNKKIEDLQGRNLLKASVTAPLGVKDPIGNITVIRHPKIGDDKGTKSVKDDTIVLGNRVVEGTAIIGLRSTIDELIDATGNTLKDVKNKMYNTPAAYVLMHCAGRKMAIGNRLEEVYQQLIRETKGVPFITAFTFGQYGYDEHSANMCGGLMLSFTIFGEE